MCYIDSIRPPSEATQEITPELNDPLNPDLDSIDRWQPTCNLHVLRKKVMI